MIKISNLLLAEFWGVYEGLKLTKSLGFGKVEINTDAQLVVNAIRLNQINKIECRAILRDICQLMEEFESVIVTHSYREANKCADVLAKMGCSYKQFYVYDTVPSAILGSLADDCLGLSPVREEDV